MMLTRLPARPGSTATEGDRVPSQQPTDRHADPTLVAHELRTPLTCISVYLEMLAIRLEGEELKFVEFALRSTRRMHRLVEDLLALARLSSQCAPPLTTVDLADLVDDVIDEIEPLGSNGNLRTDIEPAIVLGTRDDLHRLILNLIENALRHAPDTEVRVYISANQDTAVLVVEDDGPGVPDAIRDRIFDRFTRSDDADGSGLGLALVRETAEFLGGNARLESPGATRGARFVITLPAASAPARSATDELAA